MAPRKKENTQMKRWLGVADTLREQLPHLFGFLDKESDFLELRLKVRDDGTILAIAKGYSADGTPVVCFGSGYGAAGALLAIDGTIQAGNWRNDKPWNGRGDGKKAESS